MTEVRAEALHGSWVHSHEEGADAEMVFRPATRPMPPARGRMAFELRPDGTYVDRSPGPADVPVESTGSWSLEGGRLIIGTDRAWDGSAVREDELRVTRA